MRLKTIIKNELWRWNYILPFMLKYQADNRGIVYIINKVVTAYSTIKPIKSKGKRTVGGDIRELFIEIDITLDHSNRFIYFIDVHKTIAISGNILGNFCLDYSKIIDKAFDETYQKAVSQNDEYGIEARRVMEGMVSLSNRIIKEIVDRDFKNIKKNKYVQYYKDMFVKPAEHFEEALQRILFFNQILWQTRHRLNGLGRLDKILDRVYANDIKSGYITKKEAEMIIDDFLITLSKYPEYKSDSLMGDIGQIIVLGGLNSDGTYFYNDLTLMFLDANVRAKRPDPKVLLRVSKFMPDHIIDAVTECLLSQTGSPLLSNDDVVIPAIKSSFSEEDIYNYHTSACWEPFIVGDSFDQNNIAVYSYFDVLEKVLSVDYQNFQQLIEQYVYSNSECFARFLKTLDSIKWAKDPLVSMFTDQCNKCRCDISDGGAKYNNYGVTTVGLANVIDSLLNIKELVFEKKLITLKELNKARLSNFKKHDRLYAIINSMNKHYGHDDNLTIELVNKITETMAEVAKNYKNKFGGTVKFGLSSPSYNKKGVNANGDIAGRKAGMAFNTHISCLDVVYTELVRFASKLDYTKQRYNGNVIDFFISPVMISDNKEKFKFFLKGAIVEGFFQMQMNIMDSKTLIDAKKNPNKYPGLIVRVWGFSAYFNDLPENYQNILINRAIMAESI